MNQNTAIRVEHVFKSFEIPHERLTTLRERIMHFRKKVSYETFRALDDLSFEIRKGEFFSIIGRNGSGKSTLLKILAGIYTPDTGKVTVNGEISPFLELGVGFNPELSGKDNIYLNSTILGLSRKEIDRKFRSIVEFAELEQFIDLKLKNYSSGMQVRLAFATAIQSNRDILLMDEVLAVGDASFQLKCYQVFEKLSKSGRTIVFVSHDPGPIEKYSDRVLYLEDARMAFLGPAIEALERYNYANAVKASLTTAAEDDRFFTGDGLRDSEDLAAPAPVPEAAPSGDEPMARVMEITGVAVINGIGEAAEVLEYGDTICVEVTHDVSSPVNDPVFRMIIRDQLNTEIMFVNSLAENLSAGEVLPGRLVVSYRFPNYLSRGKYALTFSVWDQTQSVSYDRRSDLDSFTVHQPNPLKPTLGVVLPMEASMKRTSHGTSR